MKLEALALSVVRGGRRVVMDASLAFSAGQWTAVVGPNGAGKSSLLLALAGLLPCATGKVQLDGRDLHALGARERGRHLAWLAQQGEAQGELSALEVVRLGRLPHTGLFSALSVADHAAVEAAMHATECTALAPRRLSELSGGERQRVLVARALAGETPVLLLDEPTTHLDPPHQVALVQVMRSRAAAGATVVSVVHDLNLALAADRLVVMAEGRIQAQGPVSDPAVREALVSVFGGAFDLLALADGGWTAVPRLAPRRSAD